MSIDLIKICRTCLALDGALLSIYDSKASNGNGCVADMLGDLTSTQPTQTDGLPEKVCLSCISEINRCYSFKIKCDNSDRTLRQLLNITEEADEEPVHANDIITVEKKTSADNPAEGNKKPQKRKADTSVRILNQKPTESIESTESNEIYSLHTDDEMEAAYFVIDTEGGNNEVENKTDAQEEDTSNVLEEMILKLDSDQQDDEEVEEPEESLNMEEDDSDDYQPSSSTKKEELKCARCIMTFVHPRNLLKHIKNYHPTEVQTSIVSTEDDVFTVEFQSIEEELITNEVADDEKSTKLQSVKESPQSKGQYHCPHCKASFAQLKSRNYHIKSGKCTKTQYHCSKCNKVFISEEKLKEHAKIHMKTDVNCDLCNLKLPNKDALAKHKNDSHKMKNQCPTCKKVFTMLSTLKDHMRIHTGEKPFLCSLCGKGFSQNCNLRQHLMRHTKTKPYKCDQCTNSFVSKGELFSHMRSHTGDHPFACDVCKSTFTTSSSLAKHKRIHTGERPYGCDLCPMRFTALNTFKNHRRTHTGERPFSCVYCSKAFAQKSDCALHIRTHTGDKRYVCQECGCAFHQSGTLRTHMKTHRKFKSEEEEKTDWEETGAEEQPSKQAVRKSSRNRRKMNKVMDEDWEMTEDADMPMADAQSKDEGADLSEEDLMHFAIEECSSENNDYSGE